MLRSSLRYLRPWLKAPPRKRAFSTTTAYEGLPPLRILGPTVWCITAVGTIYLSCAAWDVYRDARDVKRLRRGGSTSPTTYEQIETVNVLRRKANHQSGGMLGIVSPLQWGSLAEADKMITGAIGVNTGIFAATRAVPGLQWHFSHLPAGPQNYTLFTSMFGHAGLFHLAANMYGLYQFAPQVARSRTFESSGSHLTAFYLSAGVLSSLAHHLTSKFASPRAFSSVFLVPGLGASGAIFGILGAWATSFPQAKLGLLFVPGSLPAEQALMWYSLFEVYGLLVGFKRIHFGHAAHLSGLAIGTAYVMFDGKKKIWQPARRLAFKQMKLLGIV